MSDDYILTKEKHVELKKELENLKNNRRKEIAEALEYTKSLGDLSENAEYHEARNEQAKLEDRIRTLETMLKEAKVVTHKKSDIVEVGSTVVVTKKGSKAKQTFHIVGSEESDITKGNISYASPMGSAMMDKKKGEKVLVELPTGNIEYTLVSVS